MASLAMHLAVGERVFPQIQELGSSSPTYGAFLLGCVLVDTHVYGRGEYRRTHFCGGFHGRGEDAYDQSCIHFLSARDALLLRPWNELIVAERAFFAGYLCHLATDESWKSFCWQILQELGIARWSHLPVPFDVLMTAYNVLSRERFLDAACMVAALKWATIPDMLAHIDHDELLRTWTIVRPHALDGRTPESYYGLLARMGRSQTDLCAIRQEHRLHWDSVLAFIQEWGGVQSHLDAAVDRSIETVSRLWAKERRCLFT